MTFEINNIPVKNPSSFKIERYNVTNMTRLSNATMTGDLIAQKKKFYFTYDAISAEDLDKILEAVWDSKQLFFPLVYPYQGAQKIAMVYIGSIPAELHRGSHAANSTWIWKNVTFNLIER